MNDFLEQGDRALWEALSNTTAALFLLNPQLQCVAINAAAEKLTGLGRTQAVGRTLEELIHPVRADGSSYPSSDSPIHQAAMLGTRTEGGERFASTNQSFFQAAYTITPLRESGSLNGFVLELRETALDLRAELVIDGDALVTPGMTCALTLDGAFQLVSLTLEAVMGWSEAELAGRPLAEFVHAEDAPILLEQLEMLKQKQAAQNFETRLVCRDGSIKWLMWSTALDPTNGLIYCMAFDVSEHRHQQRTLEFLIDLNQQTQQLTDPDEIMVASARMLGEHLGVNRCAYAEVEEDQDSFRITGDFCRDTYSIVGHFKMSDFGEEALRLMRKERPYVVDDAATDPRAAQFQEAYRQTEIAAVISVPLHKEGRFVAGMAVHQKVPREWKPDEVELVRVVVNRCWEAIERARANRMLQESEARLRFMAESMPQKVFTSSGAGGGAYFNRQWSDFTGIPIEKLRGWGWTQIIHPDDIEKNVQAWQHSLDTGEPMEIEHRFRRFDGAYRWHLTRAHAMRDDEGQIVMWIGSSTDIHELRDTQSELYESEQRFRTMADNAPVLMWLSGTDKLCFFFNKTWLDFTGRTMEEEVGNGWAENVHPEDKSRCLDIYVTNFDARREFEMEYRLRRADGEYRWLLDRGAPRWTADGEFAGYIGSCVDITEMRRAGDHQTLLLKATNVLASSLDFTATSSSVAHMAVPDLADWCAVDVLEEDGSVKRLAVAHVDPAKVAWAHEIRQRYPFDPNEQHGVARVLATGKSEFYPYIPDEALALAARDEEHLQLIRAVGFTSAMIVPLVAHGRIMGALSVISAESGRHYTPEDLALAEDLAARAALAMSNARLYEKSQESSRLKDEFLATMSHELRTPLTAILGWADILAKGFLDEEKTRQAVEIIARNAQAQVRLVEDLIDISRIVTGKLRLEMGLVELPPVVEAAAEAMRPAAVAKNIRLQVIIDPQAGPVSGDADRLQQVLWNLLSNAVKFTPKDGRVQMRLERVNSHVEITVTDNGQGINAEFLPHAFDRFRQADSSNTRRVGGLGLGLSIVRQLVELHGGTVQVFSEGEGQGASFVVSLPTLAAHQIPSQGRINERRKQPQPEPLAIVECPAELEGLDVLIVDDEPDARELVGEVLRQCGASTRTVGSVREALEAIAQSPPDVLVSDIGMPGEDGYSLIKKVRSLPAESGGKIPALALTAYARAEDRIKSMAAGFQMHVPKPVDPAELRVIVASLVAWVERA